MAPSEFFSISFHQGIVDLPYHLKLHVNKISDDESPKHSYHFIALNKDNPNHPKLGFISGFFAALAYLKNNDANFSGLKFQYILPDDPPNEDVYFERIIHVANPIFDSLIVTGYITPGEVVISSLSCPPQRDAQLEELL